LRIGDVQGGLFGSLRVGSVAGGGELSITGSVAEHGYVSADSVGGTLSITGNVSANGSAGWPRVSIAGDVAAGDMGGSWGAGELNITGDLDGSLQIGGAVGDPSNPNRAGTVVITGAINGDVTVGESIAPSGTLNIGALGPSGHAGVGQDVTGTLSINGNVSAPVGDLVNAISIDGSLGGAVDIAGELRDGLAIGGTVTGSGTINVGSHLRGYIQVAGDMNGLIDVLGFMGDTGDPNQFRGHIRIDGSLAPPTELATVRSIWIHTLYYLTPGGKIGPTSYCAIDYDGWDYGNDWSPRAVVAIGDPNDPNHVFGGNSPSNRIWHITECKGDMTNDGLVNFGDINPFVTALNDAMNGTNHYAVQFPGLAGSMVWHGDLNCDGVLNFGDINPFVTRVSESVNMTPPGTCCRPDCESCLEGGGEQMQMMMMEGEDDGGGNDTYAALVQIAVDGLTQHADDDQYSGWAAFYAALTE
jgi:hypothetical protein